MLTRRFVQTPIFRCGQSHSTLRADPSSSYTRLVQGMHAWDMMVGREFPLGRLKMELMERFHRTQKDAKTQNGGGGGRATTVEDKMDLQRLFLLQYIQMKVCLYPRIRLNMYASKLAAWSTSTYGS